VIDLGSGTGFLGFLASQLGAKSVTCIESGDVIGISHALAKRNKITNCTFLQQHSTQVKNLPRADILVSETLGNYALEENIIESIEDGKRFLKEDGVIIPGKITQIVCPVSSDRLQRDIDVWDAGFDLDFQEARDVSLHNIYVKTVNKEDLLAEKDAIRRFDTIDFSKKNTSVRTGEEMWVFTKPTTVSGFALWWDAKLVPGITLSTSPMEKPTHWEQIYLPLLTPVVLKPGESLVWRFTSDSRWKVKINLVWNVTHLDTAGKQLSVQELDMRKGYLS
jgi:SAM-dependent methyltransferase